MLFLSFYQSTALSKCIIHLYTYRLPYAYLQLLLLREAGELFPCKYHQLDSGKYNGSKCALQAGGQSRCRLYSCDPTVRTSTAQCRLLNRSRGKINQNISVGQTDGGILIFQQEGRAGKDLLEGTLMPAALASPWMPHGAVAAPTLCTSSMWTSQGAHGGQPCLGAVIDCKI